MCAWIAVQCVWARAARWDRIEGRGWIVVQCVWASAARGWPGGPGRWQYAVASVTAVLPALAQETVSDRRPPRRRLAVVVAGLVICGLAFMGRGSAAAATPAQDPAAS
ncbi:MAG: hypothetical protein JWM47_1337, partial [Acidimicrobiales bacterium]|nr:hypothetical protein [Acidimicrobiales bacterium]